MTVLDVQARSRREHGPAVFYNHLHAGHKLAVIDIDTGDGRTRLRELLRKADVVIEGSRPRALERLGVDAQRIMKDGRPRTWIRITGHGWDQHRIAFGDDAAVEGGLVAWDSEGPMFVGDAIADPLTGMLAAIAALACAETGASWIAEVVMAKVAGLARAL